MEAEENIKFWKRVEKSLNKHKNYLENGCCVWRGATDKDGYGIKSVRWPDIAQTKIERAHRLSFFISKHINKNDLPRYNDAGLEMDISHLCNNRLCLLPAHLCYEPHQVNVSRRRCFQTGHCFQEHDPPCTFRLARIILLFSGFRTYSWSLIARLGLHCCRLRPIFTQFLALRMVLINMPLI